MSLRMLDCIADSSKPAFPDGHYLVEVSFYSNIFHSLLKNSYEHHDKNHFE